MHSFLQAKRLWTKPRTLIVCLLMPVIFLGVFVWFGSLFTVVPVGGDQVLCFPAGDREQEVRSASTMWMALYFFLPTILLITLNSAILVRLWKMHRETQTAQHIILEESGSIELSTTKTSAGTAVHHESYTQDKKTAVAEAKANREVDQTAKSHLM